MAVPVLLLMLSAGNLPLHAAPTEFLFCGYELNLENNTTTGTRWRQIQNEPDLLIFESLSELPGPPAAQVQAQWLLSCNPNAARTSQVSEIRNLAEARRQVIHQLEERTLDREVAAAVFSRTRVFEGKRVKSVEAYFATRDLEYRIFALPARDNSGQLPGEAYLVLNRLMQELLNQVRFSGDIQVTISEASYRRRFYALTGLGGLIALILLLIAVRVLFRKPRRQSNANQND